MPLLERDDSILIVIDLQPKFWSDRLDKRDAEEVTRAAARAAWLAGVAMALEVPAVLDQRALAVDGDAAPELGGSAHDAALMRLPLRGHAIRPRRWAGPGSQLSNVRSMSAARRSAAVRMLPETRSRLAAVESRPARADGS